jgi:hypothetical protein
MRDSEMIKQMSGSWIVTATATIALSSLEACTDVANIPGTQVIPAAGGTIELSGTASGTFPEGAFSDDLL